MTLASLFAKRSKLATFKMAYMLQVRETFGQKFTTFKELCQTNFWGGFVQLIGFGNDDADQ